MFPQSESPSRPPLRWRRVAAWFGGAVALLALLGYFCSTFLLNHYLHSEAFRALLNEKTAAFLHTEGEYMPIHCDGFSFYSDGYGARGTAGTPVKELRADQIRTEIEPSAVFQGTWQVRDLQVGRLKIALGPILDQVAASGSNALLQPTPVVSAPSWIPNRFELKRARIEETHFEWSPPGREGSLRQMRLVLEPEGRDWIATGYGGSLQQAGWPVLNVDHVKLRCRYPDVFITESLLRLGEAENFNVSGQAGLGQNRAVDLLVKFSGVSVAPYLPRDWRAGVKGNANGEARVTGSLQDANGFQATGSFHLTGGQLEALPILEKIATFTKTRQFRQFALQKAEASFVWTPSNLTVSRVVAESEGLIRMEGGFTVERGILQGTFQLGVTPASLQWLPGSRSRVFTQERDGYVWTAVNVSGPIDRLNEDLSARLMAAAGEEVIEGVKGTIESGAKGLLDLLKPLTN